MPSNAERINAVLMTGAIVVGGAWLASLASSTPAAAMEEAAPTPDEVEAVQSADTAKTMPVTISGIRNNSGNIYVVLFDNKAAYDAYDVERAADLKVVSAKSGSVSIEFTGLSDSPYVVSVFHDENGNQDFDMAGGHPAEGYGTTRASGPYDELSFSQASVPAAPAAVTMYYLQ